MKMLVYLSIVKYTLYTQTQPAQNTIFAFLHFLNMHTKSQHAQRTKHCHFAFRRFLEATSFDFRFADVPLWDVSLLSPHCPSTPCCEQKLFESCLLAIQLLFVTPLLFSLLSFFLALDFLMALLISCRTRGRSGMDSGSLRYSHTKISVALTKYEFVQASFEGRSSFSAIKTKSKNNLCSSYKQKFTNGVTCAVERPAQSGGTQDIAT